MKLVAKIIIVIAIFAAGLYVGHKVALSPSDGQPPINQAVAQEITASLMIDFGNGTVKTFAQVPVAENSSVFDLLKKVTGENNLTLEYKDYGGDMGAFILAIDKVKNSASGDKFWQFWVNDEYAQVGASSYKLKSGDVAEWKYIKGQYK